MGYSTRDYMFSWLQWQSFSTMQILISNDTQQCQSPNPASLSLGHVRYTCAWKRYIIDQEPDGLLQLLHYKSQCRPGTKVPARASNCGIFEERDRRGSQLREIKITGCLFLCLSCQETRNTCKLILHASILVPNSWSLNGVSRKTVIVDIQSPP